jgi:adenylate cyclase class 2
MAIEIEKKFTLSNDQREQILASLEEIGAKFIGEDFEENVLYRGGILSQKGAVLRVRKIEDRTILTYKEPVPNALAFKQRIEYETKVENAGELEKIIESLGFTKGLVYEKRRKIWHFRDVEIVLDELPFGLYMEIEGSITAIAEAEMFLDAENLEAENETYPSLTERFGVRKEHLIEARF